MRRFPGQSGQPGKQGPVRVSEVYDPAPSPAQLPEPELRARNTEPIPVTRVREPATRSEIVYVVLPPEQQNHAPENVAPPVVNVNITTTPERSQDGLRGQPPSVDTRDQGERKTDVGRAPSPAAQSPMAPAEKEYQYIPPQERKKPEIHSEKEREPEAKSLTPDKEKMNEPLNFSGPEPTPQAGPRPKMKHEARDRGRQRKY